MDLSGNSYHDSRPIKEKIHLEQFVLSSPGSDQGLVVGGDTNPLGGGANPIYFRHFLKNHIEQERPSALMQESYRPRHQPWFSVGGGGYLYMVSWSTPSLPQLQAWLEFPLPPGYRSDCGETPPPQLQALLGNTTPPPQAVALTGVHSPRKDLGSETMGYPLERTWDQRIRYHWVTPPPPPPVNKQTENITFLHPSGKLRPRKCSTTLKTFLNLIALVNVQKVFISGLYLHTIWSEILVSQFVCNYSLQQLIVPWELIAKVIPSYVWISDKS